MNGESQFSPLADKKEVNVIDLDTSRPKVIVLGVLGVVSAVIFGYFLHGSILDSSLGNFIYTIAAAVGFLSIFLMQVFFIKSSNIINLLLFLEATAISAPFFTAMSWPLFFAWLSVLTLFWVAVKRGKMELDNQIRVRFFRVERLVVPGALTAISLFIALVYLSIFEFDGLIISRKSFQDIIQPSAVMAGSYVDDFSYSMTVYELAEAIALKQLGERAGEVPKSVRDMAIGEVLNQLRGQFQGYGITFRNSDTINDVLYNYLAGRLNRIPEEFRIIIPTLFVLVLFITIKGVALLFRWAVSIPAYLLYNIALITRFATKSIESRSREIIILK